MNFLDSISLFVILAALASLPSASVALVVSRSALLGFQNGIAVSVGIVLGDLVLMTLAMVGLSAAVVALGDLFRVLRIFAGGYLIWLACSILLNKTASSITPKTGAGRRSLAASFVAGFSLTLSDIKAILFYLSLLPAFLDLTRLGRSDIALVFSMTIISVGSVKIIYAYFAEKLINYSGTMGLNGWVKNVVGAMMMGIGLYLLINIFTE